MIRLITQRFTGQPCKYVYVWNEHNIIIYTPNMLYQEPMKMYMYMCMYKYMYSTCVRTCTCVCTCTCTLIRVGRVYTVIQQVWVWRWLWQQKGQMIVIQMLIIIIIETGSASEHAHTLSDSPWMSTLWVKILQPTQALPLLYHFIVQKFAFQGQTTCIHVHNM